MAKNPIRPAARLSGGRNSNITAAPEQEPADAAIPYSTPGIGTPKSPSIPPNAITIGNATGRSQIAGAPALFARPTNQPPPSLGHDPGLRLMKKTSYEANGSTFLRVRKCGLCAKNCNYENRQRMSESVHACRTHYAPKKASPGAARSRTLPSGADSVRRAASEPIVAIALPARGRNLRARTDRTKPDLTQFYANIEAEKREKRQFRSR